MKSSDGGTSASAAEWTNGGPHQRCLHSQSSHHMQLIMSAPFSLQGGSFDVADRMFHSMKNAWESASRENMSDVRELTPEFFYLPEFLTNCNAVEFGEWRPARGQPGLGGAGLSLNSLGQTLSITLLSNSTGISPDLCSWWEAST